MSRLPTAAEQDRYAVLNTDFAAIRAVSGPTNCELALQTAGQQIEGAIDYVGEHSVQFAAAGIAVATLATGLPQITQNGRNSAPRSVSAAPANHSSAAQLVRAETGAAKFILTSTKTPGSAVQLAPAATKVFETAAQGHPVAVSALTTAAKVSDVAQKAKLPVTIENVTAIHTAPASKPGQSRATAADTTALEIAVPAHDMPQITTELSTEKPTTLLIPAAQLPKGAQEVLNNQPVSTTVAEAALGHQQNVLLVTIDPAEQAAPAAHPASPPTTAASSPALPKHVFDPTNPLDIVDADLAARGITKAQTREAIEANLMEESGLQTGRVERTPWGSSVILEDLPSAELHDPNTGGGEAMWTPISKLLVEAQTLGVNPDAFAGQDAVLVHDLNQTDILNPSETYLQAINNSSSLANATYTMMHDWERPNAKYAHLGVREGNATDVHGYLDEGLPLSFPAIHIPVAAPATPPTTEATQTTTTVPPILFTEPAAAETQPATDPSGTDTQYLEGWTQTEEATTTTTPPQTAPPAETTTMPVGNPNAIIGPSNVVMLSQENPDYAFLPYGPDHTIEEQGCGVVTMSMVISTLLQKTVSPIEIDQLGNQIGANDGNGTIWSKMVTIVEQHGLTIHQVPVGVANTMDAFSQIDQTLTNGGMVIIAGTGYFGANGEPFTPYGHILALRGKDASGNYLVADPNSKPDNAGNPDKSYSAEHLLAANNFAKQKDLGIFLVTKPR